MKKIKSSIIIALLCASCFSCNLSDINVDPNNPTEVPNSLILPSAQGFIAYGTVGADLAWYSSVFVQHLTGVWNQMYNADRLLQLTNELVNNPWRFQIYSGALADLKALQDQATEQEAWMYVGVAKILMAYTYAVTTDCWGRVPFSEALQGTAILKPTFDNQEDVYTGIQNLLDDGIADILKDENPGIGADDAIYGGDPASWIKAANALKARYFNHLTNVDTEAATKVLNAINAGAFASSADDMLFTGFSSAATGENPWAQFRSDRNQHAISESFVNLLTGLNDPRLPIFADPVTDTDTIVGAPSGNADQDQSGTQYSRWAAALATSTTPMPLMTFVEQKFIEAEANFRLGNADAANAAYEAAVTEALTKVGVSADDMATYQAQTEVFPGAAGLTLEIIMTQKYISKFLQEPIEAYNDWRRTGIPALTNPKGPIPRRFPYPVSEYDFNGDNVPPATINNGVWWDDGSED